LIHILNGLRQQVTEQTLPSLPPEKEHFTRPKAERIFIAVLTVQSQFFRRNSGRKTAVFSEKEGNKTTNLRSGKPMEQDLILLSARICQQIAAC
jgi:hypothetical protein